MNSVSPYLTCSDAAAAIDFYKQAFTAKETVDGARLHMPVSDQFWGDRYGQIEDPSGHHWSIATHQRDPSPEEMKDALSNM